MPETRAHRKVRRPGSMQILMTVTAVAAAALVAVPILGQRSQPASAAEDARTAYLSLMERLQARAEARAAAEGDSAGARLRLERDLFEPVSRPRPPATATAASPTPPLSAKQRPPRLTGVFIDGDQARAAIGGRIVGVGDLVDGFEVTAIEQGSVVLKRGEQIERLQPGGGR